MNRYLALVGLLALLISGTAAAAQPATSVSQSVSDGTTLSGSITWTATPAPSRGVSSIHFFIDGVDKWTEKRRPYQFNGDPNGELDTTTLSDGTHTFRVDASWSRGATASNTVTAAVSNAASPPPPPAQCADGIDNDGDGLVDLADPGCSSASDNDETNTPPPGEPGPIAGQGYNKVFGDEFDSLNRAVWDDHIWYDDPPNAAWTNFQTVENGVLHLRSSRNYHFREPCSGDHPDTCNWPQNTATTFSSGKSFQYGYFEARMNWTGAKGAWPAFWLISTGWARTASCATPSGEIDMMEGQGVEPNSFYGTVHKESASACGGDAQNGNNWQPQSFRLADNWHTYAALWTPTQISWYLDNKFVMSAPTYSTDNQPMFLLLNMWIGGWSPDPDVSTPDVLQTQVDWVHVWQK